MLAPHISVVNLGCRVNRVESDRITADLMRLGFAIVDPQDADLILERIPGAHAVGVPGHKDPAAHQHHQMVHSASCQEHQRKQRLFFDPIVKIHPQRQKISGRHQSSRQAPYDPRNLRHMPVDQLHAEDHGGKGL